jgi:hypothetical protein
VAYALVRNGDVSEGLHHAQRVIASLPEAHRRPAITDGQKLTSIVPAAAQHQADVRQYQEWINGIEVPTA